ncbi:diguanylate cyclase [Photobacterium sanctipauli]|uniref:diguanylate cyclase n=1 Tax=Photobacterium sanctipauli TaxID=1342794 RepID=A0A2T3NNY2_9GAMM|nr:CHASE domain-containing protein [Photobacterium sanctipauli]PSW17666.1 diguanylate cyclase [Photobacterium sanctipauli]
MERRLFLITVFTVFTGVVLLCLLFRLFYQLETTNIQRQFDMDIEKKSDSLSQDVELYLESLHSIKSAFDNSGVLTPEAFSYLAQSSIARHGNIQALEWIPKVDADQRQAFEQNVRQHTPGFQFTERVASGDMVAATNRSEYYPVHYVEPLAGNEAALGFDLGSNAIRLNAITNATDSGKIQISEGVKLVQADESQTGFGLLILLPIYETVSPPTTQARRESLLGFVLGVYKITDILASSLRAADAKDMSFKLIDVGASEANKVLYDNTNMQPPLMEGNQFVVSKLVLDKGGRQWVLEAIPTKAYFASHRTRMPLLVFTIGLVVFAIAMCYGFVVMQRNQLILMSLDAKNKELDEANKKLDRLTKTDVLLGIANRRHFDETLEREFMRASRDGRPLALLVIDIDHFKEFNDTYGHQAGDRCLRLVSSELERVLKRPADMLARIGGEEFGIILPNTNNGEVVAKQCRASIERLAIAHSGSKVSDVVTVSIGVVTLEALIDQTVDSVFNHADSSLYQAKSAGRNCVRAMRVLKRTTENITSLC